MGAGSDGIARVQRRLTPSARQDVNLGLCRAQFADSDAVVRDEIVDRTNDNRTGGAVKREGDKRADGQDRIGARQDDRPRPGAKSYRLSENRGRRGGTAAAGHDENASLHRLAEVWMRVVDDIAALRGDAAPKAEGCGQNQSRRLRLPRDIEAPGPNHANAS